MSYVVTYPIMGYDVSFCDGRLFIPASANFDDPAFIEALKYAARVAPVIDVLHQILSYAYTEHFWRDESDQTLQWACDDEDLLRNQAIIAVPEKLLVVSERARAERKRREEKAAAKRQEAYSKQQAAAGYVYLIASDTGYYKIGRTNNPKNRIATFTVKLPFHVEYECLIACPDMRVLEKSLHQRFEHKRVSGEWFALDADDIAFIKSLGGEA